MTAKRSNPRGSRKNLPAAEHVNHAAASAPVDAAPLSLAQLGKLAGCSRQYVHKATRTGGPLASALLPTGDVDGNHALVRAWLARSEAKGDDDAEPDLDPLDGDDADLSSLVAKVAEWRALKLKSEARLAARREEVHAGRLIARELVRLHVFGTLETLNRRLLTDAATTIAMRARGASTLEDAISLVREHVSAQLVAAKAQAIRAIQAARTGDTPPEVSAAPTLSKRVPQVDRLIGDTFAEAMRSKAAPRVLEVALRSFARHAAGRPWTAEIFDDAMGLRADLESDVLAAIASVLVAHAEAAVRAAARALEAQHTEESAHEAA